MEFCRKHNIDPQEIDDALTYWENKKHLENLIVDKDFNERLVKSEMERERKYFLENPLKFIVYIYLPEETEKPIRAGNVAS
ncbi:MAG: hypothetical protein QXT67_04905 [Candidatus Bathyarchaeia archaeon]